MKYTAPHKRLEVRTIVLVASSTESLILGLMG